MRLTRTRATTSRVLTSIFMALCVVGVLVVCGGPSTQSRAPFDLWVNPVKKHVRTSVVDTRRGEKKDAWRRGGEFSMFAPLFAPAKMRTRDAVVLFVAATAAKLLLLPA